MVNAMIQERSVMGDKYKTALIVQILADQPSCVHIQMVGWFINQQEAVLLQK
ncbi:hypothetical protein D3C84_1305470 [compost metagenome]